MMDMRPEDFKKENKVLAVAQQIAKMNDDELVEVIAQAQAQIEERRRDRRKTEIVAELDKLFTELSDMGVSVWYYSDGDLSNMHLQEIVGEVRNTCDGDIVIG